MPTNKTECLIIPLNTDESPYKANLSRTDPTKDCLVYNLELLKSKQQSFSTKLLLELQQILKVHLDTVKKLTLKDMGKFGSGAFAQTKILKHDFVIYPGQLIDTTDDNSLPLEERIYFLHVPNEPNLHVDAKYTDCLAKYFQHLPSKETNKPKSLDGQIPAYENFGRDCGYVQINVGDETYIVPIQVFLAREDIEPESIVGIDFGKKYWLCLNKQFTYFTNNGTPITYFYLNVNNVKYQLNQTQFKALLTDGIAIGTQRILLLPREAREKLKDFSIADCVGAVVLDVHAIVEFHTANCHVLYDNNQQAKALSIKLPYYVTQVRIDPFLMFFSANKDFPIISPIPSLCLGKLLNASIKQLIQLNSILTFSENSAFVMHVAPLELSQQLSNYGVFKQDDKIPVIKEESKAACEKNFSQPGNRSG